MKPPLFHIALYEPEIPQNTGNIGRLSLGPGAMLHLIHPLGFRIDEKAVRRAWLDYWKSVQLKEHDTTKIYCSIKRITLLMLEISSSIQETTETSIKIIESFFTLFIFQFFISANIHEMNY